MLIRSPRASDALPSEITPREVFERRRQFMRAGGLLALSSALPFSAQAASLPEIRKGVVTLDEKLTSLKNITTYNNYYEFGTDKSAPAEKAGAMKTRPWTVRVEGLCNKPRTYSIEELLKLAPLEERIYRLRCVEGWSMVIPWVGFPLNALLRQVEPQGSAKFVEFTTALDPRTMVGLARGGLDWPYREGLRLDEAMHPLTILAVGLYGEELLNQNGAPVRLVVPWKYGFKSAKSLVSIRLVEKQPATAWNTAQPREYGFYSNVNPEVDHPRWSQAGERRIGEFSRRPTLMFNGYAEQVAGLYKGMDLKKNY